MAAVQHPGVFTALIDPRMGLLLKRYLYIALHKKTPQKAKFLWMFRLFSKTDTVLVVDAGNIRNGDMASHTAYFPPKMRKESGCAEAQARNEGTFRRLK
jgi:hypothetical protein